MHRSRVRIARAAQLGAGGTVGYPGRLPSTESWAGIPSRSCRGRGWTRSSRARTSSAPSRRLHRDHPHARLPRSRRLRRPRRLSADFSPKTGRPRWGESGENGAPLGSGWGGSTAQTGSPAKEPETPIAPGQSTPPADLRRSAPRGRRLQEALLVGGHSVRPHTGGHALRHELDQMPEPP